MVIPSPEFRAEVLRVLHRLTYGMPTLTTQDVYAQPLSPAGQRLLETAGEPELALLNAVLEVEAELRDAEFAALEQLLTLCQFDEGALAERVAALPDRAFALAVSGLYELGWVNANKED